MKKRICKQLQGQVVDNSIQQLLYEICHTTDKKKVAGCFKLAIEYAADIERNKIKRREKPVDTVIIGLDNDDYKEVFRIYPESIRLCAEAVDMTHLYETLVSTNTIFGNTHLLVANLKINPTFPFMTKEIDYLEKITKLFCDKQQNVKWGLVKTNSVARVGIDIIYQDR